MTPIWLRVLPYTAAVTLVTAVLFGCYHLGLSVKDAEWRSVWNDRDTQDAQAKAENQAAVREREQVYQQSINKAVQDGQRIIDQATADAAAARTTAGSVQLAADNLAVRLAASEASGNSCTAAASKATARAAMVLADVLKRANQRAGELAEVADQARARGMTCEQAYEGLADTP